MGRVHFAMAKEGQIIASRITSLNPATGEILREFQCAGDSGLRALVDGTVGKIKDFFVFRSQFVPKTGSDPVNVHNLAFTKSAIGLVLRRRRKRLLQIN